MMKTGKSIWRYALFSGVVLAIAVLLVLKAYGVFSENKAGAELETVLSHVTYEIQKNDQEVKELTGLSETVEHLSRRDKAVYYGALTKLYMLCGDSDNALRTFVDTQIHAEISVAYDTMAWLYADIAQVYIDFCNYDIAQKCIETALRYSDGQQLDHFFFEYCYVMLAETFSYAGDTEHALECVQLSEKWDDEDLAEYQSMELRRELIMGKIALKTEDYVKCRETIQPVSDYIQELGYMPMDALWASGIYYPWLELQTAISVNDGDFDAAIEFMDRTFATGILYGQSSRLMISLGETLRTLDDMDSSMTGEMEKYVSTLIKEYPSLFVEKNASAGEHIYNSNMITIAVFVQQYKLDRVYAMTAQVVLAGGLIITMLVLIWRRSEKRGRVDGLTGAYNRKFFNQNYEQFVKSDAVFGLIMFDIDYFKQINDGFGHEAGDAALKGISRKIMSHSDRDTKLYRYGGDEFCILCKRKTLEEMAELAEKIRAEVETAKWEWDGMKTSLSIGVACSANTDKDVLTAADEKVYESKEAGRNHVSY